MRGFFLLGTGVFLSFSLPIGVERIPPPSFGGMGTPITLQALRAAALSRAGTEKSVRRRNSI